MELGGTLSKKFEGAVIHFSMELRLRDDCYFSIQALQLGQKAVDW